VFFRLHVQRSCHAPVSGKHATHECRGVRYALGPAISVLELTVLLSHAIRSLPAKTGTKISVGPARAELSLTMLASTQSRKCLVHDAAHAKSGDGARYHERDGSGSLPGDPAANRQPAWLA
jgi:hypothetical protein